MYKRNFLFIFAVCLALSSCVKEKLDGPDTTQIAFDSRSMVPGVMRIKVSEQLAAQLEQQADTKGVIHNIGVKSSDDALAGFGFESMKRTFPYSGKFEERTRKAGLHRWYTVRFSDDTPLTKAGNDLNSIEGIEFVEPVPTIIRPQFTKAYNGPYDGLAPQTAASDIFNDPYLNEQWHYYNDGTYKGDEGCDINVVPVWEMGYVGSPEIVVAVIDGGIDYEHEDIKDNMWVNEAELNGAEGVDDDGNGYVDDIYGHDFVYNMYIVPDDHGTHVAGTIAAVNNNGIGVCGVAGGDKAKGIKGARVMSCQIFWGEDGALDVAPAFKYAADNGAIISQNSWGYGSPEISEADKEAIDYFIEYAGIDENGNQTGPMKGGIVIFAGGNDNTPYSSPGGYERVIGVSSVAADFERAWYSNYGSWADIAAPGGDSYKRQLVYSSITNNRYDGYEGTSMACPHVSGAAALLLSIYGGPGFTNQQLWDMLLTTTNPVIYEDHNNRYQNKLGSGLLDVGAAISMYSLIAPDPIDDFTIKHAGSNSINLSWTVPADKDNGKPVTFNIYYSESEFDASIDRENLPAGIKCITLNNPLEAGDLIEYTLSGLKAETTYYLAIDSKDNYSISELSPVLKCTTEKNYPPEIVKDFYDMTMAGPGYVNTINLYDFISDRNGDKLTFTCNILSGDCITAEINDGMLTLTALAAGEARLSVYAAENSGENVSAEFNVTVLNDGPEYLCYPNPVIDMMYIKTASSNDKLVNVSIETPSGKRIMDIANYKISAVSPEAIDLSGINTGDYIVTITDETGKTYTQNIMKL